MTTSTRLIERNYTFLAAGRAWVVPALRLRRLPDGTVVLPQEEGDRIHRAIANEICGSPEPLTADELEFLCDVAARNYAQVATAVGVHRSALTRWRTSSSPVRQLTSLALKKWFWFQLFGEALATEVVPLASVADDAKLLRTVHDQAIATEAVSQVRVREAS